MTNKVISIALVIMGVLATAIFIGFVLGLIFPSIITIILIALGLIYCGIAITCVWYIIYFAWTELRK